jgi:hypothetical protein
MPHQDTFLVFVWEVTTEKGLSPLGEPLLQLLLALLLKEPKGGSRELYFAPAFSVRPPAQQLLFSGSASPLPSKTS